MIMDDLCTPADVEREMIDLTSRIDKAPLLIKQYHERVREARLNYRTAYAVAYSSATGTQGERKAEADVATEQHVRELDVAEVEYKFAMDVFEGLKTKLRALQSVSSLMKASMFGSHGGL